MKGHKLDKKGSCIFVKITHNCGESNSSLYFKTTDIQTVIQSASDYRCTVCVRVEQMLIVQELCMCGLLTCVGANVMVTLRQDINDVCNEFV